MRLPPASSLLLVLSARAASALESNPPESPQVLGSVCSSAQGRTSKCEVELDVPSSCVLDGATSDCPVVFFFHGAGGTNDWFARTSGVHDAGMIGVYPQGEDGWNTGPKGSNACEWDDFDCTADPDEGAFAAAIIAELRALGANGNVYLNGNSNGAALSMRLAANAGDDLPIRGIVTKVTQLLASPPRSGPGVLNYNQPASGGLPVSVLNIMGTADLVIPYEGGTSPVFGDAEDFQLMPALESMAAWAAHNGCDASPSSEEVGYSTNNDAGGTATFYEYSCPEGILEHYAVHGAGHSFGAGAALHGASIDYDLAYDFIRRLEDNGNGGGDPPACVDDPGWHGRFSPDHDCDYVAALPSARCAFRDPNGVPASDACGETCGGCDGGDPVLSPPTPAPQSPGCADDPDWRGRFNADHDCAFVGENPNARCGWTSEDDVQAVDVCLVACDQC